MTIGSECNCFRSCQLCLLFSDCYNVFQTPPLRGLGSGDRGACVFAGLGLCALSCASSGQFATLSASGCPCLELRAAPFVCRMIAGQLVPAISFRFGARTPHRGHDLDRCRRQSHCCLPQTLLSDLLQIVLLEGTASAEEEVVSCSLLLPLVFDGGEFNAAQIIGERSDRIFWMPRPAIKNAGGLPPALGSSPRKNHHSVYATAFATCASKSSNVDVTLSKKARTMNERRAA